MRPAMSLVDRDAVRKARQTTARLERAGQQLGAGQHSGHAAAMRMADPFVDRDGHVEAVDENQRDPCTG